MTDTVSDKRKEAVVATAIKSSLAGPSRQPFVIDDDDVFTDCKSSDTTKKHAPTSLKGKEEKSATVRTPQKTSMTTAATPVLKEKPTYGSLASKEQAPGKDKMSTPSTTQTPLFFAVSGAGRSSVTLRGGVWQSPKFEALDLKNPMVSVPPALHKSSRFFAVSTNPRVRTHFMTTRSQTKMGAS